MNKLENAIVDGNSALHGTIMDVVNVIGKYVRRYFSDLLYDALEVAKMNVGDVRYFFVRPTGTHIWYSHDGSVSYDEFLATQHKVFGTTIVFKLEMTKDYYIFSSVDKFITTDLLGEKDEVLERVYNEFEVGIELFKNYIR